MVDPTEISNLPDETGGNAQDVYSNTHDIIGVDGIIRSQRNEIEKKKVRFS